jgi:hypothetical protein
MTGAKLGTEMDKFTVHGAVPLVLEMRSPLTKPPPEFMLAQALTVVAAETAVDCVVPSLNTMSPLLTVTGMMTSS